jgi:hypothetical protein
MERLANVLVDFGISSCAVADINLSDLQKTLDAQGIELVDNQKESVVGRKALADKTKGNAQTD